MRVFSSRNPEALPDLPGKTGLVSNPCGLGVQGCKEPVSEIEDGNNLMKDVIKDLTYVK